MDECCICNKKFLCDPRRVGYELMKQINRTHLAVLAMWEEHVAVFCRREGYLFVEVVAVMEEPNTQLTKQESDDDKQGLGLHPFSLTTGFKGDHRHKCTKVRRGRRLGGEPHNLI